MHPISPPPSISICPLPPLPLHIKSRKQNAREVGNHRRRCFLSCNVFNMTSAVDSGRFFFKQKTKNTLPSKRKKDGGGVSAATPPFHSRNNAKGGLHLFRPMRGNSLSSNRVGTSPFLLRRPPPNGICIDPERRRQTLFPALLIRMLPIACSFHWIVLCGSARIQMSLNYESKMR
ncbi:hypothetical protein CEXT_435001 [Caerostris extrusa]|uniref:Uncharacterized protein n=1 Tax=Caerostris extrusa TaxID=172846 RepID=A0AAV4RR36_CAEEX|nr:hypothetical protein CEXT_435001 [Caerostris extrusa]